MGYSTLAVSLPKSWTKKMNLSAGDLISYSVGKDNVLKLLPGVTKVDTNSMACMINADKCEDKNMVIRIVTGCYIVGYESITVRSANMLDVDIIQEVRTVVHNLMGVGIVEQDVKSIVLECFIDPNKFQIGTLLKRLFMVVNSMLEQAISALTDKNYTLTEEIKRMGDETDKIYALIVRQLLLSIGDDEVAKRTGIETIKNIAGDRVISKTIEDIGDEVEMIGHSIGTIIQNKLKIHSDIINSTIDIIKKTETFLNDMFNSFINRDVAKSNEILNKKTEIIEECIKQEEILIVQKMDPVATLNISKILWSINVIIKLSEIIPEVTINRVMETENEFLVNS